MKHYRENVEFCEVCGEPFTLNPVRNYSIAYSNGVEWETGSFYECETCIDTELERLEEMRQTYGW